MLELEHITCQLENWGGGGVSYLVFTLAVALGCGFGHELRTDGCTLAAAGVEQSHF